MERSTAEIGQQLTLNTTALPNAEIWWDFVSKVQHFLLLLFPLLVIAVISGYLFSVYRKRTLSRSELLLTLSAPMQSWGLLGMLASNLIKMPPLAHQVCILAAVIGFIAALLELVPCWQNRDYWSKNIRQKYASLGSNIFLFVMLLLQKADVNLGIYSIGLLAIPLALLVLQFIPDRSQSVT